MKFCPTCQTRYDDEVLRFCTKDGTPLVDESPDFNALPSEAEDFGEETVVRRKPVLMPTEPLPRVEEREIKRDSAPRIVIPTSEPPPPPANETVRTKTTTSVRREPLARKSNTGKIVFATILGTMALLASAAGIYWLMSGRNANDANKNVNANFNAVDTNLNTNLSVDNSIANFNTDTNGNTVTNGSANSNVKTNVNAITNINAKSPTPKPSASPSPTANTNANGSNSATPTPTPRPTPSATPATPSPSITPTTAPTAPPDNRPVNAGVLNGRATSLPKPAYPSAAKQMRASGQVSVQILIDEGGNVLSARATSGHPLLRAPAEAAARQSRFNPVKVGERSVQATGILVYNFVN